MNDYMALTFALILCATVIFGLIFAIKGAYKKDKHEILKVAAYFLAGMLTIKGFPFGFFVLLFVFMKNREIQLKREEAVAAMCGMFAVQAFNILSPFIRSRVL